jgi:hypothetical protein
VQLKPIKLLMMQKRLSPIKLLHLILILKRQV